MRIQTKLAAAGVLLSLPVQTLAQDSSDGDEATTDQSGPVIIVTGAGLDDAPSVAAYSKSIIERDELLTAPSGRIEEALGAVAGFQQFRRSDSRSSNPTAQGVTLRALGGNASSRALVLLDGVPMLDPFFGRQKRFLQNVVCINPSGDPVVHAKSRQLPKAIAVSGKRVGQHGRGIFTQSRQNHRIGRAQWCRIRVRFCRTWR